MKTVRTYCKKPLSLSSFKGLMNQYTSFPVRADSPASRLLGNIHELFSRIEFFPGGLPETLWMEVVRGKPEDWDDFERLCSEGLVSDREEYLSLWREECPEEKVWFEIASPSGEKDARLILTDRKSTTLFFYVEENPFLALDPGAGKRACRFLRDLYSCLSRKIEKIGADPDSYNDYLHFNLPFCSRYGSVSRKEVYEVCPEWEIHISDSQAALLSSLSDTEGCRGEGLSSETDLPMERARKILRDLALEYAPMPDLIPFRRPDGKWFVQIAVEEEWNVELALCLAERFENEGIPFVLSSADEMVDVLSGKGRLRVVPAGAVHDFDSPEICLPFPDDTNSAREREALISRIEWTPLPRARIRK